MSRNLETPVLLRDEAAPPGLELRGVLQDQEEAKENDVFWVVEKGVYMCPGNRPFEFKP